MTATLVDSPARLRHPARMIDISSAPYRCVQDYKRSTGQMTLGTSTLQVPGQTFTSADVGKAITVSDVGTAKTFTGAGQMTSGQAVLTDITQLNSTHGNFTYGDVGKIVQVVGAGAAGAVLSSRAIAMGYTSSVFFRSTLTLAANASTNVSTARWITRGYALGTITAVPQADTVTVSFTADNTASTGATFTDLDVAWGTDNSTGLAAAASDAAILGASAPLNPVPLAVYIPPGPGFVKLGKWSLPSGVGVIGAGKRHSLIATLASEDAPTCAIAAATSAAGFQWRGFTHRVVGAHRRQTGADNSAMYLSHCDSFEILDVASDGSPGVAWNFKAATRFRVKECSAWNSWADGFNVANTTDTPAAGASDGVFEDCDARNTGDDMFATNAYADPLIPDTVRNIRFVNCRGVGMRNGALGRGFSIVGGDSCTASGYIEGTDGPGVYVGSAPGTNAKTLGIDGSGNVTLTTAPTTAVTAGMKMRIFSPDSSTITEVTVGTVTNTTHFQVSPVPAFAPQAGPLFFEYGLSSDAARYGLLAAQNTTVTAVLKGCASDISGEGIPASVALVGVTTDKPCQGNRVQARILASGTDGVRTEILSGATDQTPDLAFDNNHLDVDIDGATGFGVLLRNTRNTYVRGVIRNTTQQAVAVGNTVGSGPGSGGANRGVSGIVDIDVELTDVASAGTTGSPLNAAVYCPSDAGCTFVSRRVRHANPSGTGGGTHHVVSYVVDAQTATHRISHVTSESLTSDVWVRRSVAGRVNVIVAPFVYDGDGDPNVSTNPVIQSAPVDAMYLRRDAPDITHARYVKTGSAADTWKSDFDIINATATGSAPTMGSSLWYAPSHSTQTPTIMVNDKLYAVPIEVSQAITVAKLGLEITTAGTSGSVIRLGIYSDVAGLPATLILDAGTIDGTKTFSTSPGLVSSLSQALPGNRAWFAAASQGSPGTAPIVRMVNANGILVGSAAQPTGVLAGMSENSTSTTGAFPGSFPARSATNLVPRVVLST